MVIAVVPRPTIKTRAAALGLRIWNRMPPKVRRTLAWSAGVYASLSLLTDIVAGPAVVYATIDVVNLIAGV